MTSIGVVIVSFNTCDLLRGCLESLRGCALPLRTIVVENGSRDASAAMVRACFPEAELVALEHNVGFAAGTNVGLGQLGIGECRLEDHPTPNYVLLLNPDTIVHAGAIEMLAAFLAAHPRVGAVGPRLLNTDGTVQAAAFRFPTLAMTLLDLFPPGEALPGRLYGSWWHGRYPHERSAEQPFPIDHPLGACILARRAKTGDAPSPMQPAIPQGLRRHDSATPATRRIMKCRDLKDRQTCDNKASESLEEIADAYHRFAGPRL